MGIIGIIFDCLIFSLLFIPINRGMSYWINLVLYVIGFIAKALILYGTITFQAVVIYCVIGAFIVWVLQKIVDALSPIYFMVMAIIIQEIVTLTIGMIGLFK